MGSKGGNRRLAIPSSKANQAHGLEYLGLGTKRSNRRPAILHSRANFYKTNKNHSSAKALFGEET